MATPPGSAKAWRRTPRPSPAIWTCWSTSCWLRRLPPLHANVAKRLVKSPKVYVRDSGLVHTLLRLDDEEAVLGHPVAGFSWEGFVIERHPPSRPGTHRGELLRHGHQGGGGPGARPPGWRALGNRDQARLGPRSTERSELPWTTYSRTVPSSSTARDGRFPKGDEVEAMDLANLLADLRAR